MKKLRFHWSCHPFKDKEWYAEQNKKMSPDAVAAELDIQYSHSVSSRVFPEFTMANHVKRAIFEADPFLPVYRIWDFGKIVNVVLYMQVDQNYRKKFLFERVLRLQNKEGSATLTQIQTAISDSQTYFPGYKFIDICDPAGANRHHDAPSSSIEMLQQAGIYPLYHNILHTSTQNRKLNARDALQADLCRRTKDGEVITIYCTEDKKLGCPTLVEALAGAYGFKKDNRGNLLDIVHEVHPYEDIMDCVFYFYIENGLHDIKKKDDLHDIYKSAYTNSSSSGMYF